MSLLWRSSKTTTNSCLGGKRLSETRAVSRMGFHKGFRKNLRGDEKGMTPANLRKPPGEEMVGSIYRILTIGRWESLNFMKIKRGR
ncbi:pentatricopeptide repeat-containing protein [Dorcoceras hygrometricum]|uniref:Pentatricopeptide repeat-containing protein n=1 Tax=Dorcoceras hygrometricum TaxID=472368 RepID=A0A2Z7ATB9_9LAMI|nr:pentatricopeptide repeat-containing protein [Dorcoceras hygrometricum]